MEPTRADEPIASVDQAVERLKREIRPQRLVLFGSASKGAVGSGSDIDMLVVADLPGSRAQRQERVSRALRPRVVPMDILVYTPDEFRRLAADPRSFVSQILSNGRVVYDADRR